MSEHDHVTLHNCPHLLGMPAGRQLAGGERCNWWGSAGPEKGRLCATNCRSAWTATGWIRQAASQSVSRSCVEPLTRYSLCFESYSPVNWGRPLWQEVGSVVGHDCRGATCYPVGVEANIIEHGFDSARCTVGGSHNIITGAWNDDQQVCNISLLHVRCSRFMG
jgi:hypothetical protein